MNNVDSYPTQAFQYIQNNVTSSANSLASSSLSNIKSLAKKQATESVNAAIGVALDKASDVVSDVSKSATSAVKEQLGTAQGVGEDAVKQAQVVAEQEKLDALKNEIRQKFFIDGEVSDTQKAAVLAVRNENFSDVVAKSATMAEGMRESIVADAASTTATPISGASIKEDIDMNTDIMKKMARQLVAEIAVQTQLFELNLQ